MLEPISPVAPVNNINFFHNLFNLVNITLFVFITAIPQDKPTPNPDKTILEFFIFFLN